MAHFLHPTAPQRQPLLTRLAGAVVPGGTLLWAGHPYDSELAALWGADRFSTAAEVALDIDPTGWDIVVAECRPRRGATTAGHHQAGELLRACRR